MVNYAIIGLGFGDESKGLTTDVVCSLDNTRKTVVRFSGGQQAGHTVRKNGVSHVFSNFGSGTLGGHNTYWSKYCTLDPVAVMNEFQVLKEKGVNPILYIDENCPITTPFEKVRNQKADFSNGTCGTGVGPTWRREDSFYSLTAHDLNFPAAFKLKMKNIEAYYSFDKTTFGLLQENLFFFYQACNNLVSINNFEIVRSEDFFSLPKIQKSRKIFEGSQGLLLDQNIGFFPNVTSSNTDTTNVRKIIKENRILKNDELVIYFVTRAYQTRHGNGPMTNEDRAKITIDYPNETNVTNQFQGEFRKSILDVDLLSYAISKEHSVRTKNYSFANLMITCFEHIVDGFYQFTHNGQLYTFTTPKDFAESLVAKLPIKFNEVLSSFSDDGCHIEKL